MTTAADVRRFEHLYQADPDPWDYLTSDYERQKYEATLAALPDMSYDRCLEVGCSIGVLTERLAECCGQVVAIDFARTAVELARAHLCRTENAKVLQASFPEQIPGGNWDLIVCSEVLYYLRERALERSFQWLRSQLLAGATVLAVSWRGVGRHEPWLGDQVHDRLTRELGDWHALDSRCDAYRLDRFDPR